MKSPDGWSTTPQEQKRAESALRSELTRKQWEDYRDRGWIMLKVGDVIWTIDGTERSCNLMAEGPDDYSDPCFGPFYFDDALPQADFILAQVLFIKALPEAAWEGDLSDVE